ncbi:MAG: PspA/IM30 family protein [Chloroflexia bacterium]
MAGIFDRMSTILRANINSMLDKSENPEVMIDQIIRDMASAIAEARGQVADMIAQEKILQANVKRNQDLANEWQSKATLAVTSSRDDLAREALRRKNDFDENSASTTSSYSPRARWWTSSSRSHSSWRTQVRGHGATAMCSWPAIAERRRRRRSQRSAHSSTPWTLGGAGPNGGADQVCRGACRGSGRAPGRQHGRSVRRPVRRQRGGGAAPGAEAAAAWVGRPCCAPQRRSITVIKCLRGRPTTCRLPLTPQPPETARADSGPSVPDAAMQ